MPTENDVLKAVSAALMQKLQKYTNQVFNKEVCYHIYNDIFQIISDIIDEAKLDLTQEARNYIAQSYYAHTTINAKQELIDDIFTKIAKLSNISTPEIIKLTPFVRQFPDCAKEILYTLKRRG